MLRRFGMAYFGGAVGALANSLALWLAARAGLLALVDVAIAPTLSWPWLAPRLVWGSLWGLGYPLVLRRARTPMRAGLLLSLAPSLAQLFWFFPQQGHGMLGVNLGALTCIAVLGANAIWGAVLGFVAGGRGPSAAEG
jgi:hypothetical protein